MSDGFDEISESFDLGGEQIPADSNILHQLHENAEKLLNIELMIETLENELKAAKGELQKLRTVTMPTLMVQAEMSEMTYRNHKLVLKDFISGSLPKDPEKRGKAIAYLESHDGAGIIQTEVLIRFPKSQYNKAIDLHNELTARGLPSVAETGVHAQTYCKYARDRLENGQPIDTEALGLFVGKVVDVKEVSEKKPKKKEGKKDGV